MQKQAEANIPIRSLLTVLASIFVGVIIFMVALRTGNDPATTLSIFSTRFLGIFIEAAPFLLMGSFTSGLIEVFVSRDDIVRWIPRHPIAATVSGTFMGLVFPVCECGVVPVARRLFTKGLPMSVGIAFLLAAPVMNPIVFASTFIAFGFGPVLIGRFVMTAIIALAVGLIFAYSAKTQEVLLPESLAPVMGGNGTSQNSPPRKPFLSGFVEAIRLASEDFFEMGKYLVIGCIIAAAMQTIVSQDVLLALGKGPIISVLILQVLAFVMSACSTVDAFIAVSFANIFTTGSILSFLTFGPMVDIKSTMMFAGVFQRKIVLYLITLPFLMSLVVGIWVNLAMGYF